MSYGLREESTVIGNLNFLGLTQSWIEPGNDLPTQTPFKSDRYYMQLNISKTQKKTR
jgi:hypothetical protein